MKKLLFSLLISLSLLAIAQAAEYGGIGGRPANPHENDPRSKNWFIYTLNPGQSKQDALIVQNNSDETVNIRLYPADSATSTDGGFALEQFVEPRDFVGKWIELEHSQIILEPRESKEIPFTLNLPNDPKLNIGEHTGGILIEKIIPESKNTGGLQLLTRVGVRVYVNIPGEKIEKLEIEKIEVILDEEKRMYTALITVKNDGNTSQDITINSKASNLSTLYASVLKEPKALTIENSKTLQVLRNDTLTSNFEFQKPRFGKMKLEVAVNYGEGKVVTANPITIDVPLDHSILVLMVLVGSFLISLFALFSLRQYAYQKEQSKRPKLSRQPKSQQGKKREKRRI